MSNEERKKRVILGSSSKWRKKVLEEGGINNVQTIIPDIDEKAIRDEDAHKLTVKVALGKLERVLEIINSTWNESEKTEEEIFIITSDMVVVCEGQIREKPENEEECRKFLRSYSEGKAAEGICGVVVHNYQTKVTETSTESAKQFFLPMSEEFITDLIKKEDVMFCCGGFVVEQMEGYLDRLEGDITTIMGLPFTLTSNLLHRVGYSSS